MMRVLIFSDSHGSSRQMREALSRHPEAAAVCHLGDGAREAAALAAASPIPIYAVCGNCDMACDFPVIRSEIFDGVRVLLTHGHRYGVKQDIYTYYMEAKSQGAAVALFGHTHRPFLTYEDGIYLFNPGSVREGTYGLLDITPGGVLLQHGSL